MTTRITRARAATIGIIAMLGSLVATATDLGRPSEAPLLVLQQKQWIHGTPDCGAGDEPVSELFQYDSGSYVIRQSKCSSYEAPFVYVLVGSDKILVLDTGASESSSAFPVYEMVASLRDHRDQQILVLHSHGHQDHYSGDSQFEGRQGVTVVAPTQAAVRSYFGFNQWPQEFASIELGNRTLTVIPTPGHQEEAISLYDPQTQWLLTGDTIYPGVVYVKEWAQYRASINRLTEFVGSHPVSAVLGSHIEMNKQTGVPYEIGTRYQPDEAPLPLSVDDLRALNRALQQADDAKVLRLDSLVVEPMGLVSRTISNLARWLTQ